MGARNGFGSVQYSAADNLTFAAIPEPSAYAALGGFGAIGLALYRRRRRCV